MPVNSVENRLLLYSVDGNNYSPIPLSLYDISIDDVVETNVSQTIKYLLNPVLMTITLPHKKMSRKKFKKWLMSRGFHRDIAEWFCNAVKSFRGKYSYECLYFCSQFLEGPEFLCDFLMDILFPINK